MTGAMKNMAAKYGLGDLNAAEIERFNAKVDRSGDCHLWTGGDRAPHNYGLFTMYREGGRVRFLSHRAAYYLATGVDPGDLVVRHRCDNPPCVNPDHLVSGTQSDNVRDAVERGRNRTEHLAAYREQREKRMLERRAAGVQFCRPCGRDLPITDFSPGNYTCRSCRRKRYASQNSGGTTPHERNMPWSRRDR